MVSKNSTSDRSRHWWPPAKLHWLALAALLVFMWLLIRPAMQTTGRSRRPPCLSHLHNIGLALHNYHGQYNCFPPAYVADEQGRPMHSWRVLLLPYLDKVELYEAYRFDEPWDGPHNRRLHSEIFDLYRCPDDEGLKSTQTSYVAVVGSKTAWPGLRSSTIDDFTDGLSDTLLVVEVVNSGIHWMEPRDLQFDEIDWQAGSDRGISSRHPGAVCVTFADGRTRAISKQTPSAVLRALLTIAADDHVPADF